MSESRLVQALPPAFRHAAFRAYWFGNLASVSGSQMFRFAQLWVIHDLTGSPLYLGFLGVAQSVPAILFMLVGGVVADRVDRRRLLMLTQPIAGSTLLLLGVLTFLGIVEVWHLLAVAAINSLVEAFDWPARQSIYPRLIDRETMTSAVALDSAVWQGTRIGGPALAGFFIAAFGSAVPFFMAGCGYFVMALVMWRLRLTPQADRAPHGNPVADLIEGVRFIWSNSIFAFLIGMVFFNSFFGMSYIMLMPVFAVDVLKVGVEGQGLLMSVGGIGALLTTLRLGAMGATRHRGIMVIGGACAYGLVLAAFGVTAEIVSSFYLALVFIFTLGVFQSVYMISVTSSLQIMVPDRMRGRVMGIYAMNWSIFPLGGMQAGALASWIGAPLAVTIGGLAVAMFAIGPSALNQQVRRLGQMVHTAETAELGSR